MLLNTRALFQNAIDQKLLCPCLVRVDFSTIKAASFFFKCLTCIKNLINLIHNFILFILSFIFSMISFRFRLRAKMKLFEYDGRSFCDFNELCMLKVYTIKFAFCIGYIFFRL